MKLQSIVILFSLISIAYSAVPTLKADAADKVSWKFKDRPKQDVSKILLEWEPFAMVEDKSSIASDEWSVLIQSGEGEYTPVTTNSRPRGGKYKYTIDIVPCQDHHLKFVLKGSDGEVVFELPEVIPASSSDLISSSGFNLEMPANIQIEQNEDSVALSWDASLCATSYLVVFMGPDGKEIENEVTENTATITEFEACSQYDVYVTAVIDESYSDEAYDTISTHPSASAAEKLDPKVSPSINSVKAQWDAYGKLSCVNAYAVKVCKDGVCGEAATVELDNTLPVLEFTSTGELDQCSDYTISVKPIYEGKDLAEKVVPFRTLSPPVQDVNIKLMPVNAVAGDEQMITVSWSAVQCASAYEIFQHVSAPDGDWETIGTSEATELSIKGVPCTEYRYGVKVSIDGVQSDIVEAEAAVMTPIDNSVPYVASNLISEPSTDSIELSWDHAKCITSYRIKICKDGSAEEECPGETIEIEDPSTHNLTRTIENLSPCSGYSMQIFATTDTDELAAETTTFETSAPAPTAPENLSVGLNAETNKIDISFEPVACATGYKVYKTIGDSEEEVLDETTDLSISFDSPEPCVQFSYGVSALVNGEEGPKTELLGDKVPPKNGEGPKLIIDDKFNSTVIFILETPDFNQKCEIEEYHMKYRNLGHMDEQERTVAASDLLEGKIVLDDFPGAADNGMFIEGRIKYLGFESWSPFVSTKNPVVNDSLTNKSGLEEIPEIVVEDGNSILVPIVIGVLVAVVVLVIVIFFIVKRKRSQDKYDAEIGDGSESKKLKDNPEV
eukprot:GFUD01135762.1.p1 GENE.GFUD01135762.1~~GFUD01135762.1.p1  ORF type:complete len:785 (-),score=164.61 GFUD01135762.1:1070-3424(-)